MKIVVSVYVSPNYVFCWLLVVSLEIFIAVPFVFSRSLNIACRSTQNAARVSNDFEDYTKIKPLNKKKYTINSLLCSSATLLMFLQTFDHILRCKSENRWPYKWFWNFFFNGLAKSPRMLRSSRILNEFNMYYKIVKYCILSEVCMIKTVPHVLFHLRCDV